MLEGARRCQRMLRMPRCGAYWAAGPIVDGDSKFPTNIISQQAAAAVQYQYDIVPTRNVNVRLIITKEKNLIDEKQ